MNAPDCESNRLSHEFADRCVGRRRIEVHEREGILSGRSLFDVECGCYETSNCIAEMAEIKLEFIQAPTESPSEISSTENVTTPTGNV